MESAAARLEDMAEGVKRVNIEMALEGKRVDGTPQKQNSRWTTEAKRAKGQTQPVPLRDTGELLSRTGYTISSQWLSSSVVRVLLRAPANRRRIIALLADRGYIYFKIPRTLNGRPLRDVFQGVLTRRKAR